MPILKFTEIDFLKNKIEQKLQLQRFNSNEIASLLSNKNEEFLKGLKGEKRENNFGTLSQPHLYKVWNDYRTTKDPKGFHNFDIKFLNSLLHWGGYSSLSEFEEDLKNHTTDDSNLFDPESIVVEELKEGQDVCLGWFPDYYMTVTYLGENNFRVKKISKTGDFTLTIGDEFYAKKFILRYLYQINNDKSNIGYPRKPKICISLKDSIKSEIGSYTYVTL